MTHDRVYRPAIGPGAARRELEQGAGSQFDSEVVEAFLGALKAEGGIVAQGLSIFARG
jgi:HD-GYP domain-containing protein (c-di-GMP phosphodiesterase class II)